MATIELGVFSFIPEIRHLLRRITFPLIGLALLAQPVVAETPTSPGPAAPDTLITSSVHNAPKTVDGKTRRLLRALIRAQSRKEGRALEKDILAHWREAPSDETGKLFKAANFAGSRGNFFMALGLYNMLEQKAPDWSEVYSQRAYVKFKMQKYEAALVDINKALKLQPSHFVALSGKFFVLVAMRKPYEAREALETAVAIHPYLRERALLGPGEAKNFKQL